MRGIFQKYWPLLTADNTIKKFFKPYPEITYRRAPSMRDRLVHSHHMVPCPVDFIIVGTFPCGTCDICPFIINSRDIVLPNGNVHLARHRITCKTIGVVYLALCSCGWFYVGKTKRLFFKCIKDHIAPLYKHLTTTALNRHIAREHNYDPDVVHFAALDHVPLHARGGNIDTTLLQMETRWMHLLDAVKFPGLNEYISFKSFLWIGDWKIHIVLTFLCLTGVPIFCLCNCLTVFCHSGSVIQARCLYCASLIIIRDNKPCDVIGARHPGHCRPSVLVTAHAPGPLVVRSRLANCLC